jgi:signal transduction histidine kinase/CheY-like chemotaxis protein
LIGVIAMFAKHRLEPDMLNSLEGVADKVVQSVQRRWIEEQRAAFLEREQAARRLAEDASRLKDDFLAMISHELRAPLTAILGWAQMLRSGALDRASAERALLTIERNAKSQAHLVGDLLDASRIATGKLTLDTRAVELMSIVEAAVDAVRPSVEAKNLRMQIVLEPWVGPFNGDQERLRQVVWNLLSNAIKFTSQGGLIEIRLERLENKALLIVSDTGQGIDPEYLPHVFDRFSQMDSSARRRQGGLGLGLAIVKHIVELHGGAIYAYSRGEGQGSDFMVTLPLAVQSADGEGAELWAPTRPEGEETRSGTLSGVRVLVVDDEHDTREILSVMLTRYGAEIRTAGSAAEAMDVFGQWLPDVLVSDIGMPEEDGYALIKKIRALPPENGADVPAIALTAFASAQDKKIALAAGFQRHIAKPVEPVALAKNVALILGRSDEGISL